MSHRKRSQGHVNPFQATLTWILRASDKKTMCKNYNVCNGEIGENSNYEQQFTLVKMTNAK